MEDEEMDNETERSFCFWEIGFHEAKYLCELCSFFSKCKKDAEKCRRTYGILPWEDKFPYPRQSKSRISKKNARTEKKQKNTECKECQVKKEEEEYLERFPQLKGEKCPYCG